MILRPDDTLVTMGDYVDRGPDSRGVLEVMCELRRSTHVVPLKGNHEQAMLWALSSRIPVDGWLAMGGDATLRSYGGVAGRPPA